MFYETEIIDTAFAQIHMNLPPSWNVKLQTIFGPNPKLDATINLIAPDGQERVLNVEVRPSLEPRQVRQLQQRSDSDNPSLFLAPFISKESQEKLRALEINYADMTGNACITLDSPSLFIKTEGATKNPYPDGRGIASLKGQAAGSVIRALCDFTPPFGVRELATRANLSPATLSKVAELLEKDDLLVRTDVGRIIDVDIQGIIRRWAQDYQFLKANPSRSYFEPRGVQALLNKLQSATVPYCITGSLAAIPHAPISAPKVAILYVTNIPMLAEETGLKQVETGGNVILVEPKGNAPFLRTHKDDGITYAAFSQVAADLLTSPGRGPSEGEALLDWMMLHQEKWRV